MTDITVDVPQGENFTLDASSPVEVNLDGGVDVSVEAGTAAGPAGPPGEAYIHQQSVPAAIWTVDHNLGFWPDVVVYDTSGRQAEGLVTNPSLNRTTLTFSAPFAGTARMS